MASPHVVTIPNVAPYMEGEDLALKASSYAAGGLYIAPTVDRGPSPCKNPGTVLGSGWPAKTVTGGADGYALFDQTPDAVGIALHAGRSGLVIIDIDTEDEEIVSEPLRRAIDEEQPPYQTTRVGGVLRGHYLFMQPPGRSIGNSGGKLGDAWGDVRGTNGVIILPGSKHAKPDGRYEWKRTGVVPVLPPYVAELLPDGAGAESALSDAQVQAFLAEHVSSMKPAALKGVLKDFASVSEHGRHTGMIRAACWAMREARAGIYPAREAANTLHAALREAVKGERPVEAEMRGILAWAVAQALAEPEERMAEIRAKHFPQPEVRGEEALAALEVPAGRIELSSPNAPAKVARELAEMLRKEAGGHDALKWWQDEFYRWVGPHWEVMPLPEVERWVYQQTEHAKFFVPDAKKVGKADIDFIAAGEDEEEPDGEWRSWNPTAKKVADVLHALSRLVVQHTTDDERVLACSNGVVDVSSGTLLPHTPERFNLTSVPFAHDPEAQCPRWEQFLHASLPGDLTAHDFCQEWFGYILSGRTDMQTIGSFIGVKRGGKGTMARILQKMIGEAGCTSPDISDLGSTFGRASLIGKTLAVMADVRWNSHLATEALKCFLAVSGEDRVTFPRKHKADWTGRSGVRFMVMSNDTPTFADRSNAIGARMIHVRFTESFAGREDYGLEGKLTEELPGILNWALRGLQRLSDRGRFTVPQSGLVIGEEMAENANPVATWIEEECIVSEDAVTPSVSLLAAYSKWAVVRNMKPMDIRTFHRGVREAGYGTERRKRPDRSQEPVVTGISCPAATLFGGIAG